MLSLRRSILAFAILLVCVAPVAAQQKTNMPAMNMHETKSTASYHPGLGELMTTLVQPRHIKLGLAGAAQNWAYAAYALGELRETFDDVGKLVPKHGNLDIPPAIAPLGWSCAPLAGEDPFSLGESDISLGRIRHHLPSAEKARSELAYREKVDPATWIEKTVEFLLAHPPATDGTASSLSPLDFDYAAEDELLAWWDRILATSPVAGRAVARGHAYEHPKLTERTEARQ